MRFAAFACLILGLALTLDVVECGQKGRKKFVFRRCLTAFGCFPNQCCVRKIETSEDSTSVTFDRRGICRRASVFLNEDKFALNRIGADLEASADRVDTLATESIGEDFLLICRLDTLGPDPEDGDSVGMAKRMAGRVQVGADVILPHASRPEVATARDIEDETGDEDENPDDETGNDMDDETGDNGDGTGNDGDGTGDNGDGTGDNGDGTGDNGDGTGNNGDGTGDNGDGTGDNGDGTGGNGDGTGANGDGTGDNGDGTGDNGDGTGGDVRPFREPEPLANNLNQLKEKAVEAEGILQSMLDEMGS
ncbi:autotransporter adhesin BpaC-like [Sycon ciliatum]|uniref:autotransporter adhesin BpaC-like n=1 Tax=Sycon ciliatum TaxID=27933 RepID=UPI0031F62D17